jgi:hypothetical protein
LEPVVVGEDTALVNRLRAMRGKGESDSDVRRGGSMADRYNEGKALDAVLRFIETRDNAFRRDDGWSPDDPRNPDPDPLRRVDYVCTVGRLLYAFEHTRIEPFPNQIRLADHNQKLFDPIIERFDHRTDREVWDLYVPVEASATVKDVGQVQQALIKWIDAELC